MRAILKLHITSMLKTLHSYLIVLFCIFCFIPNIFSQQKWELLNPTPTYKIGKNIQFASQSIGYIINDNEILETSDFGKSWKIKQNIDSGNDLKFYNSLGFLVGNNGYILKSINSGVSWNKINTGFSENFNSVNIINDNTILISSRNSLIKSLDGGNTWIRLQIPNVTVNKTFFTTDLIGHAACTNGTMLKTIDGGVTWYSTMTSNVTPSSFFTVYFINQNIGFSTREHDYLYKTIDGGETWIQIPNINDALYSFSFLNENVGYAAGEHGVIFKTVDGGLTWTWASFQNGRIAATHMYGIYFLDINTGFATGDRGRIIKTIDGGKTWIENSPTYNDIKKLDFLTKNTGYAQVGNSFFKTNDSGANWNLISSINYDRYHSLSTFDFLSENIGYAATGGTYGGNFFKTTDSGATWIELNNGNELIDEGINTISFISESTGYISGGYNRGKVMKTTDGGKTWEQRSNYSFYNMQFLNENVGYAHNLYDKKIYKTTDGGYNWSIVFTADEEIKSIDFIDIDNGYIVGSNGLLFKTNNGGTTWSKLTIPYEYYTFIKFYSKNVGYIFDEEGQLFKTENGGANWKSIFKLNTGYGTNSITIINKDIYLAGAQGKIFKSQIDFEAFTLQVNHAEDVLSRTATLSGSVSSNEGTIENIHIEYFNNSLIKTIETNPKIVNFDSSLFFSLPLSNLEPNTTYYYRIVASYNNIEYYSNMLSFTTQPDYKLTMNPVYNFTATNAVVTANITSYGNDISNIEFEYSNKEDFSEYSILKNGTIVKGNTSENLTGELSNLKPKTTYYVRIKAIKDEKQIYSSVSSFTTKSEYEIYLYNPNVNANNITLTAYVSANSKDITNIVFEYGILNYENSISTNPNQVLTGATNYVYATITNLDLNQIYFYRLKAFNGTDVIYSKEGVLNISRKIFLTAGNIINSGNSTVQLNGFINAAGYYLNNIQFEYGTTENFGTSIDALPSIAYGYSTMPVNAVLNNLLTGVNYYYRLKANNGNNIVYSDIFSFTTTPLGIEKPTFEENILLYPNPSNGIINIHSTQNKNIISFKVIDQLGKALNYENNIQSGSLQKIDLSDKSAGIYLIQLILDDNSVINKRIILK